MARRPGPGGVVAAALAVIWTVLLFLLLIARVILIVAVPRTVRGSWRHRHGRQRISARTGKVVVARSARITARQNRMVHAADRNRCVARHLGGCAAEPQSRWFFEIDHGTPWIAGGYTWLPNLFLACHFHNQTKYDYYADRRGVVHYHRSPYGGVHDMALAAAVRACERRARWNPLRYLRVLGA